MELHFTKLQRSLSPYLIIGLYINLNSRVDLFASSEYKEVTVPKGERLQLMFQDGSKVYLNSDSHIRYPKKFGLKERKVELKKEKAGLK